MNHKTKRVLIIALLISITIHLLLLTGIKLNLPINTEADTPIIEAKLATLPTLIAKTVSKHTPPSKPHIKPQKKIASAPPSPAPISAPSIEPEPATTPSTSTPDVSTPEVTAAPNTPTLNTLPSTLTLQYKVVKGEDGFGIGRATYLWISKNSTYTLTSITEGTGLFSLFQPGKLVQISQGKINANGLAPDDFWIQRGRATADKSTAVHFDYDNKAITISKDNNSYAAPLEDNAQDILSVIFQLALRSPFSEDMLLHVTSGKQLKPYHAIMIGTERINTALGEVNTVHLQRPAEAGEDAIDMWLASDYNFVPVKVRIDHSKFGIIEQLITGMETAK
ncbi:MAG: DUF3108 domain-containing protein [Sulfuriferula sp.]|nr:DUF3108 domain-containing protein [Sulfuriferula sp.]